MKKTISTEQSAANIAAVQELLADAPRILEGLLARFSSEQAQPPLAPGERSISEILAHLLNVEARTTEAIYLALLVEAPILVAIHPERQYGALMRYDLMPLTDLIALLRIRRAVLTRVMASITEQQWSRVVQQPGKQRKESVYWQARALALHELEHLDEIKNRINTLGEQ